MLRSWPKLGGDCLHNQMCFGLLFSTLSIAKAAAILTCLNQGKGCLIYEEVFLRMPKYYVRGLGWQLAMV